MLTQICRATEKSSPKYPCPDPPISSCSNQRHPLCQFSKILNAFWRIETPTETKIKTKSKFKPLKALSIKQRVKQVKASSKFYISSRGQKIT
jgi:hypothetical protein